MSIFNFIGRALSAVYVKVFHDGLGWHSPGGNARVAAGINTRSTCRYCDKNIMRDSQGNWF